jgi:hypothetical protein
MMGIFLPAWRKDNGPSAGEDVLVMRWKRFPYVDPFGEKTAAISPG